MRRKLGKVKNGSVHTFLNPNGYIEQHYTGSVNAEIVIRGVSEIKELIKDLTKHKKTIYILINISDVAKHDQGSHLEAVRGMRDVPFYKLSIYGPLHLQVLLNTLGLVAGRQKDVRAFDSRVDAIKWLREV